MTSERVRPWHRAITWLFSRIPGLTDRWALGQESAVSGEGGEAATPWTALQTPLKETSLGLVTTGGLHLLSQDPFDTVDPHGDPSVRVFASHTPAGELTITHPYYDHADADRDLELVLPRETVRAFVAAGRLGGLGPRCYSLMGHIDGPYLETLRERTAPEIARDMAEDGVDAVLLVPA